MKRKILTVPFVAAIVIVAGLLTYLFIRANLGEPIVYETDPADRPLPYLSTWNTKFSAEELDLASRGHAVIPNFPSEDTPSLSSYEIKTLLGAKDMNLPISMTGTQWESDLRVAPYKDLDTDGSGVFTGTTGMASSNPNNIKEDKTIQLSLDPFGPASQVALWGQIGTNWSSIKPFQFLSQAYPIPPALYLVGNNETPKIGGSGLGWPAANGTSPTSSLRYKELFLDTGKTSGMSFSTIMNFNNRVVGDSWIERYSALFSAWRANMTNSVWKNGLKFIAYNGIGDSLFRAYDNWATGTSTHTTYEDLNVLPSASTGPRASYYPYAWDGASPEVYLGTGYPQSDSRLVSTDFDTMNWVFMLEEARQANPDFYFEHSIWDGYIPSCVTTGGVTPCCTVGGTCNTQDKRTVYTLNGQTWTPERYAADQQYSMWLTRPQALRQFLTLSVSWADNLPYFLALTKTVDRVHNQPVLSDFWKNGTLVENPNGYHPYQSANNTTNYTDADIKARDGVGRWFYLNDDLDTYDPATWTVSNNPEIKVYSMALVKGGVGSREWLVYTHSPKLDRTNVTITVPDFGDITVNSTIAGNFYHLKESDLSVTEVVDTPSTLTHLIVTPADPIVAPGSSLQFSVAGKDQYDADSGTGTVIWSATGGTITQAGLFTAGTTSGTYQVTVQSGAIVDTIDMRIDTQIAHWTFSEGSGQYVSDANSRDNACYNKAKWTTAGKFGSAVVFDVGATDNSTSVYCDHDIFMSNPTELTISAWVKINQGFEGANVRNYIAGDPTGNLLNSYGLSYSSVTATTGQFSFYIGDGAKLVSMNTTTRTIDPNHWYFITGTYKPGNFMRLYIDGSQYSSKTSGLPTKVGYVGQDFTIGNSFKGTIDDVQIYNQALLSSDVLNLYQDVPSSCGFPD